MRHYLNLDAAPAEDAAEHGAEHAYLNLLPTVAGGAFLSVRMTAADMRRLAETLMQTADDAEGYGEATCAVERVPPVTPEVQAEMDRQKAAADALSARLSAEYAERAR